MICCFLSAITLPALTLNSLLMLEGATADPSVKTPSRNVGEMWNLPKNLQGWWSDAFNLNNCLQQVYLSSVAELLFALVHVKPKNPQRLGICIHTRKFSAELFGNVLYGATTGRQYPQIHVTAILSIAILISGTRGGEAERESSLQVSASHTKQTKLNLLYSESGCKFALAVTLSGGQRA